MGNNINRKQFLKLITLIGTASGLTALTCQKSLTRAISQALSTKSYLPIVLGGQASTPTPTAMATNTPKPTTTSSNTPKPTNTPNPTNTPKPTTPPPPGSPKVVHVYNPNATSWNYSNVWYGDYVDQIRVNQMMDEGLKSLTGKPSVSGAWSSLLPGYQSGKGIAIKVNFNNSGECTDSDNLIDSLMQPVNALIRGMKEIGVQESDIWVFDAIRDLPTRFLNKCQYPGVRFFDRECSKSITFDSSDLNAQVIFQDTRLSRRRVADVIINASYLINMPILKDHGIAGVTLGFKNHFGSLQLPIMGPGEDNLHYYIDPNDGHYRSNYNPLVDIYSNPHILNKTILTVGDGLFGAYGCCTNTNPPSPWQSFGGKAPNSLFLSKDPVAIDCVMLDILTAESGDHGSAADYLKLAAGKNMGIYEKGDPWGSGYNNINYTKIELT